MMCLAMFAPATQPSARWHSPATDSDLVVTVATPPQADPNRAIQARLLNLADDASNDAVAVAADEVVVTIDYARHPAATASNLSADVLALREAIRKKGFPPLDGLSFDVDTLFILRSDSRLIRGIEFARDGDRILGMDAIVPAAATAAVLEFSCDNVKRMGAYSLQYCQDTLIETLALHGFVAAMADHPVRPPYKGLDDPMPQSLDRARAAVAVLRSDARLRTTGKVGAIGFSRGGPFAAMLAAEGSVDAALVHGNRYDYLHLPKDDPMLPRFTKAWGPFAENRDAWARHGAAHYLNANASPMFLNTSAAESAEYRAGLARWHEILKAKGVQHEYLVDADERGHRVSTDPAMLDRIAAFFHKHLDR